MRLYSPPAERHEPRRALVLVPGTVNYFYNQAGRRAAEALEALGFRADLATLADAPAGDYDWCLVSNVAEVLHAAGGEAAIDRLRAVVGRCGASAGLALDCVQTPWYRRLHDLSGRCGIGQSLDLGLADQSAGLPPEYRASYRFVFNGLTPSEQVTAARPADADRPLPWAFVGHVTPYRAALVDHLVSAVDPRGFVYLPSLAPYPEHDSPHLTQGQFERVLAKSRYHVWCSHHEHFYMEPERFRMSLLAGGLPVKVIADDFRVPADAPFRYLMVRAADLAGRLTPTNWGRMRARFAADWGALPTLADGLAPVVGAAAPATALRAAA